MATEQGAFWADVLAQDRVVTALQHAIQRQRVAHAYLLYGPQGVGKKAVALAFARTLQCMHLTAKGEACGACDACVKARHLSHPDIHVMFPYPADGKADDVQARYALLAENPYVEIDYARRPELDQLEHASTRQAFYPVARINEELKPLVSMRPFEGRYKVIVMLEADRLRIEAANALLKILEEPAPYTVFILTTSRIDRILPTILSRCQQFRLDPLPEEVISQALMVQENIPEEQAWLIARMADGSYTRALELLQNEMLLHRRELVVQWLRELYRGATPRLLDLQEELVSLGRGALVEFLQLVLLWIRDLILYRETRQTDRLLNRDQIAIIERFCTRVPEAQLEEMIALIESAMVQLHRNIQPRLVMAVLAQHLHKAIRGVLRERVIL